MPHYKTKILLTGSPNRTLKIPHKKAFIYNIDVSDTVKAIGLEIKFPHIIKVNIHCIFVTVTVSVIVPFQINIKSFF